MHHSGLAVLNVSVLSYADHSLILCDLNQVKVAKVETTHLGAVAVVFRVARITKLDAFETAAL